MANTIGTAYINIAPNMSGIQGKIAGGLRGSGSQFAQQFGGEVSGKSAVIIGAVAGVAQAAVTNAMNLVTNSISNAVARVDTLNAAQKTFQYMGFAARDSAVATKAVTASILGLPTPLDSAIRGMTSLAATYGNIKLGQKVFSALNDAILGMGGSTDMVNGAIQQLSQLPLDGPLDAQTWNSLRNNGLTPVMVAMSKDMGRSVSQLKSDFGDGTLKVQDFVNELTKMDTKGGGGLVSLHKIALTATSGIGTGFANMQTAISRGLANIIQAVGQKNISNAIATIGKVFEKALNSVAKTIPKVVAGIKEFFGYVDRNKDIFFPIAVGIGAIVAAITAWKTALLIWSGITRVAAAVQAAFNAVMAINPITAIALAIIGLVAGLTYFFTQTETGRKVFADFTSFLAGVWDKVHNAIQAVANFLGNAWAASVGAVTTAFNAVKDTAKAVFDAIAGFIEKHKKGLTDIAIVITTIVLPKLLAMGIQAGIAAARAVAAFAVMAAGAVANAAISTAAWIVSAAKSVAAFVAGIPRMVAQFVVASAAAVVNAAIATAAWVAGSARMLAGWVIAFAGYLAGIALSVAATLLAGAQMALAWLMALGPIGIIIAAVAGATALIIANWSAVKGFVIGVWHGIQNAVGAVIGWIAGHWPLLLAIITGPIGLAVLLVSRHWASIKQGAANMINGLVGFFSGLPGRILGALGNMGGLLYNSGRDLINGLINGAKSLLSKIGEMFLSVIPGWIKTPFKKALGIHSPSTVFMGFGGNITEGLVSGIAKTAKNVTGAVSDMADSAMAGMTYGNLKPAYAGQINAPSPAVGGGAATQRGDQPAVVQHNNIYNQVDLNSITRELAWRIRR